MSTTEEQTSIHLPEVDADFINNFFLSPKQTLPDITDDDGTVSQFVKAISLVSSKAETHQNFAKLLNRIAEALPTDVHSYAPLYFKDSSEIAPAGKSLRQTRSIAPEILILPPKVVADKFLQKDASSDGKLSPRYPWSIVESIVEVKPRGDWKHAQALDYLETILQHRPDKVSVIGMSCNQLEYRFYYIDACTQRCSVAFQWENGVREVIRFLYSLHRTFKEGVHQDKTMTLHDIRWVDKYPKALWHIQADEKTYEVQSIYERTGPGRRTWIGIGKQLETSPSGKTSDRDKNSKPTICVVKDIWRENSKLYVEGDLLNRIHKNGIIPGVIRPISAKSLDGLTAGNRTKHRLILGSIGFRLSSCTSVLEFLKVMYDLIETHEKVLETGVLHRDISWFNVLCNPKHYVGCDGNIVDQPNIRKILGDEDAGPLCLLTDFDHGSLLQDKRNPKALMERTGTPMFTAAEIAHSPVFWEYVRNTPMSPQQLMLEGQSLKRYMAAYGEERYQKYNTFIPSILSTPRPENPSSLLGDSVVHHRPHHDVESVYWIVVWFLLKAWPTDTLEPLAEIQLMNLRESYVSALLSRRFDHSFLYVAQLLSYDAAKWKRILPLACQSLAPMLAQMEQYICIYLPLHSEVPLWHAHEAFKRLLLKEIIRMTNENTPIAIQGCLPRFSTLDIKNFKSKVAEAGTSTSPRGTSSITPYQSCQNQKRARSISTLPGLISSSSENVSKRQCLISLQENTARTEEENIIIHECIQDIANDEKWFM